MSRNPLRNAASGLLLWGSKLLDDSIPADSLLQFISSQLTQLVNDYRKDPSDWSDRMISELSSSLSNANDLSLRIEEGVQSERHWTTFLPTGERAMQRFMELSKHGVLHQGRIEPDSAELLTSMLLIEPNSFENEVATWMERLLRHVEVRRKDSLQIHPGGTHSEHALIRNDMALCFLTASHKWGDLRFLNAALKLNDWAFSSYRGRSESHSLTRYLLVLTECELALKEVGSL